MPPYCKIIRYTKTQRLTTNCNDIRNVCIQKCRLEQSYQHSHLQCRQKSFCTAKKLVGQLRAVKNPPRQLALFIWAQIFIFRSLLISPYQPLLPFPPPYIPPPSFKPYPACPLPLPIIDSVIV